MADLVDAPSVPDRETPAFTFAQARALLAACESDRFGAFYIVALMTGLRLGELLSLRWEDVDWIRAELHVRRSIARVPGVGWVEQPPKSKQSRRSAALTPLAVRFLERHQLLQRAAIAAAGDAWEDNNLVFPNSVGRTYEPQNVYRRSWYPLLVRAGLPRIRIHDLRHTFATLMREEGADLKTTSEALGHSQIGITADLYTHNVPLALREAVERLEKRLLDRN
ncbi:MAG: site-specific integrase [Chloroflexi bacterium]|nr:site-specific integrase [Chloroflexota bacterium]